MIYMQPMEFVEYLQAISSQSAALAQKVKGLETSDQMVSFSNDLCGFAGEVMLRSNLMIDSLRGQYSSVIIKDRLTLVDKPVGLRNRE